MSTTPKLEHELLPSLVDGKPNPKLFSLKVKKCLILYDFSSQHNLLREWKTQTLQELYKYFVNTKRLLVESTYADIIELFCVHAFRPLRARVEHGGPPFDLEEDVEILFLQPDFAHLKIVYELFIRFLESPECNPQLVGKFIDESFVAQVLYKFDSEDKRERDLLKTILHRIYGKLVSVRGYIRNAAKQKFISVSFEAQRFNGIGELLDMLGSIITGFMTPLKIEHKLFLTQALLPLLKLNTYPQFHSPLTNCLLPFLQKDQETVPVIFKPIIKFFPKTEHKKALVFLGLIEKLLDYVSHNAFLTIATPLMKLLSNLISGTQTLLAERALMLLNVDYVMNLSGGAMKYILPVLFPALYVAASKVKTPWNNKISPLARHYLGTLCTYHNKLFNDAIFCFVIDGAIAKHRSGQRELLWHKLAKSGTDSNLTTSMEIDVHPAFKTRSLEFSLCATSSENSMESSESREKKSKIQGKCSPEIYGKYRWFLQNVPVQDEASLVNEIEVIQANLRTWKIVKVDFVQIPDMDTDSSFSDSSDNDTETFSDSEEDHGYHSPKGMALAHGNTEENNNNKLSATISSYSNSSAPEMETFMLSKPKETKPVTPTDTKPVITLQNASKLEISDDPVDTESDRDDDNFFDSDDDDEFNDFDSADN